MILHTLPTLATLKSIIAACIVQYRISGYQTQMRFPWFNAQEQLSLDEFYPYNLPKYLTGDQRIDMRFLLGEFQQFWRENSEIWQERFEYREAAPHLILMAFLQRVLNGGGRIDREYSSGRGRIDLCLNYAGRRYPVELKIHYNDKVYEQARNQLLRYMERLDCNQGRLVIFDQLITVPWDNKIFWKTEQVQGKTIHMVGC
jgi:hypothetical protein